MAGKLIVIEGLDGSGKATQTQILLNSIIKSGKKVKKLSFPDYNNPSSSLVKMYLGGELGDTPGAVNPYAASSFYAVDRVASFLQFWQDDYNNGSIILADRYATSNYIYQLSKLEQNEYDSFIEWLDDYEYNKLCIPRPDLVIYLDVPPDVSQKLMSKRYKGDESKKDLHEKNVQFLYNCRKSALFSAKKLGWKIINCSKNGEIRKIDDIANDIEKTVKENVVL